ncbi:NfeD family protein [Pseudoalteromonas sp. MMG010]|uniref:NfeD family protein n=1 Tax=Pseudoalteromonas sp. MMG010 TaxID=2822685 RepID=UPI001B39E464|nr:NfeD family protein [Pseudoalteromonas sp. MMG010]MBQ4833767.1 NfeD family protein [Pseudoalteromonas sp. MMG010]
MDILINNLPQTLMILGVLALIIEVAVLGLSTFILLFFGISLIATGALMSLGILNDALSTALWSNTVITAALAVLLWRPLKKMQNKVDNKPIQSDFAELSFVLNEDVSIAGLSTHHYSGISWQLKSEYPIASGTPVIVVKKEVGVMWVSPANES